MAKPSTYIMGIIIFTMLTVSGVAMFSILTDNNPNMVTGDIEQFNNTFNVYNDVINQTNTIADQLEQADSDPTGISALVSGSWQTLRLLGSSLNFMHEAIKGMSGMFGIPVFVPYLIIAMVTVMLVFAIWGAVFQRDL